MLGWSRAASRRGSSRRSSKSPLWRCGTLIATFFSIQASLARKTVPKPPEPRLERIWYLPTACPSRNIARSPSMAHPPVTTGANRDGLHGRRARAGAGTAHPHRVSRRAPRSARSAPPRCCATRTSPRPILVGPEHDGPAPGPRARRAARRHRACAIPRAGPWREDYAARLPGAAPPQGRDRGRRRRRGRRCRTTTPRSWSTPATRTGSSPGSTARPSRSCPPSRWSSCARACKRASSVFIMVWPDRVLFYADCSVNIAPDPPLLAEIGRATAATARSFGIEPRVAFLSFSTRGSAEGRAGRPRAAGGGAGARGGAGPRRRRRAAVRRRVGARRWRRGNARTARCRAGQRARLPRPERGQHRLQDHRAAGRRLRHRPHPPGAAPAGERRLARLLGAGPRRRRR